ncbi:MAG: hypothetical protein H0U73_10160, partial [Tatlockia sp.]|nr:hypothetical protein [Tatlockia sp.]
MPKNYPIALRYFNFRKRSKLFSNTTINYQWETWSIQQAIQAEEIAPLLNEIYYQPKGKVNEIIDIIEKLLSSQAKKSKSLKISVQEFKNNPAVKDSSIITYGLYLIIQVIEALVEKNYSIAFNFSEAFLLFDDEILPSHFSQANDYQLKDSDIYQEIIGSFAYQFAKALFNKFRPTLNYDSSETDKLVASHYTSIRQQDSENPVKLDTPLATLPCFNSAHEAFLHYEMGRMKSNDSKKPLPQNDWIILSFNSKQPLDELFDFIAYFQTYYKNNISELILILQGKLYEDASERARIHNAIKEIIDSIHCTIFLHILMLTTDSKLLNPNDTLLSIAPELNVTLFSPLANHIGYYLSDPNIFAAIGQNQRKQSIFSSRWLKQAEISSEVSEVPTEIEEIKGYIYGQEPLDNIRSSKRYNKQELKSQIGLTFTFNLELQHEMQQEVKQSQSLKQNQELAKQQSTAQQRQNTLNQQVNYPFYKPPLLMSIFFDQIRIAAEDTLRALPNEEKIQEEIYYTSWYRANYSNQAILNKLKKYPTSEFLIDLFAKMLGLAYTISPEMESITRKVTKENPISFEEGRKLGGYLLKKSLTSPFHFVFGKYLMVPLHGYSCESIEFHLIKAIFERLPDFSDGIDPSSRHTGHSYFYGNTVMQGWDNVSTTLLPKDFNSSVLPVKISNLALLANCQQQGYQSHIQASLSIFEENEAVIGKNSKSYYFLTLLELFKPYICGDLVYITNQEDNFLTLIKLAFPDYLILVNKFFEKFELHNLDNIRIFVQLLISVGQENFKEFLDFLVSLDQRSLLDHFYKIYFKYAPTVFSLVNFFYERSNETISHSHHGKGLIRNVNDKRDNNEICFLTLVERTPVASSAEDWPLFERFAYAVLVFAAKNHMLLISRSLNEIEAFWSRVGAKFLAYSEGNAKQQQLLIKRFVMNLISEEGLTLEPLRKLETLLVCLENLLDHAIEKHTLEEQISELSGISLAWTDVPFATTHNGFQLICKEMQIKAGSIGYEKTSYAVSLYDLKQAIEEFKPASLGLTTAVFRYLGKESFREDIDFYRNLYPAESLDPETNYINQLIWAYYVSAFTGLQYNPHPDEVLFFDQCNQFLQQHPFAQKMTADKILSISQFLRKLYQLETNGQKGTLTLWMLWHESNLRFQLPTNIPIPEILAFKFNRIHLKRFLLTHQQALKSALPLLLNNLCLTLSPKFIDVEQAEKILVAPLIANLFAKSDPIGYEVGLQLLNILVPNFGIKYFLENLLEVLVLLENLHHLKSTDSKLLTELQALAKTNPDIKLIIAMLQLCREKLQNKPENLKPCTLFIHYLATHPELLPHCTSLTKELELVFDYCLEASVDEKSMPVVFELYQTLKADAETLKMMLNLLYDDKVYAFFLRHLDDKLPGSLLITAAKFIKKTNDPITVFCFIEHARYEKALDDELFIARLLSVELEKLSAILFLVNQIGNQHQESFFNLLDFLTEVSEVSLHSLVCLCKHHQIPTAKLLDVLKSPSLETAIDSLEEALYQEDLLAYQYEATDIAQKITEIKYNSWDNNPAKSLINCAQKTLECDYKKMMAYIQNRPVYIESKEGMTQSFTVHQLKHRHFPILFKELQARIKQGENKKENQLVLLAVCAVALKRSCKKFPRSTQLLPLIHSLGEEGNLVQELKTGAGKSIIAAIHAVLRIAAGRTVLIPTENEQLGWDGIVNFQDFYQYLGIHCSARIIEAHSPDSDFIPNGINYSTPYGLALFFISMAIKKVPIAKNCDLIWDEIDASLTSTVPFRLAATLDPLLLDTKNWSKIYGYLLDFVKEKELFLDNRCSDKDDIHNFRQYCLSKIPEKQLTDLLKQVPDSFITTFIDSARLAVQLEENIDYMVVEKEDGKKSLYGAPILPHNSRAEPRASFGSGAQPLLHAEKNKILEMEEALTFSILPDTETIVSMTPKNLADGIRRKGGLIIGATATPGMPNQLQEFRQLFGISAVHYPHFHPDRCEDLGIFPAEGFEDQKKITLTMIQEFRTLDQPVLIICESAQAASDLNEYLSSPLYPWKTQSYYGYSLNRHQETNFIAAAGEAHTVSITTKCESRGADFDSDHEHGFLEINLCTNLTEEELIQIKGRSARNNKPGQFCSVVDVLKLGLRKTAPKEELALAFKSFQ